MAEKVLHRVDPSIKVEIIITDGSRVTPGDVAFLLKARCVHCLWPNARCSTSRSAMSGIATMTRRYQDKLEGLKTKVLDTRKTTPGMRTLEKEAVRLGGGTNHRIGLLTRF